MNIRIPIILAAILSCGLSSAQTAEDAYRIAYMVVHRITGSDEWRDCYDEKFRNSPHGPYYPTIESALESLSNTVYSSWSLEKRQRAFDMFLDSIAQTNNANLDRDYLYTAGFGLEICGRKGYANVLPYVKDIVASSSAPCKEIAIDVIISNMNTTEEKALLLFMSSTNQTGVSER